MLYRLFPNWHWKQRLRERPTSLPPRFLPLHGRLQNLHYIPWKEWQVVVCLFMQNGAWEMLFGDILVVPFVHNLPVTKTRFIFFFWAWRNSTISRPSMNTWMNRRRGSIPLWRVTWGWRCAPLRSPGAGWPALWWTAAPQGSPSAWPLQHRKWTEREARRLGSHLERNSIIEAGMFSDFFSLKRLRRTYEVVVHSVLLVILRDGVFPVDDLQLGPLLKWVLLETQQVEDASEGLSDKQTREKTINTLTTQNKTDVWTNFVNMSLQTNRQHFQTAFFCKYTYCLANL